MTPDPVPPDARPADPGPSDPVAAALARLDEVVAAFRRVAAQAVATAADPRASATAVKEARHLATFGLAAVGAAFKGARKAARPDDPEA
ncbi:MAG: hypothetical protein U1E39_14000 [Planctomycetota bacterium]